MTRSENFSLNLPGYEVEKDIGGEAPRVLVRARRRIDGRGVLLETAPLYLDADVARLRRELELSHYLRGEVGAGMVWALDLLETDGLAVLVRQDPGGAPLDRVLEGAARGLEVAAVLELARQLAEALAGLHQSGFMHRDVRPCHILADLERPRAGLMGLGFASGVPREWQGFDQARLSGTALAYISPEQTGRTNRLVDYRTDLYSLGVTLFEMLTGVPPFALTDPLELIHAHIAKRPPAPSEVVPEIPEPVSAVVRKLLAKSAEERYQGGWGLARDLGRCLSELRDRGKVTVFEPGERDVPARFELPQGLFGREAEIEKLTQVLEAAGRGEARALFVTGYTGVGKTSLVREVRRHTLLRGGVFVTGKYNALERGTPYSAMLSALRDLVRPLLLEEASRVASFRERLEQKLGASLGVLLDVLPELESIVGIPPAIEALEPMQAKNRFHICVGRFLSVFAAENRPRFSGSRDAGALVLFLDDLQWIDLSSLDLIRSLLGAGIGRVLLLGAYRDNEVDEHHPLLRALAEIEMKGVDVETLSLSPLGPQAVEKFLASALRAEREGVAPLAETVYRKTAGNPFFVKAFLDSLYEEGNLEFDPESGWVWDLERIAERGATENVLDLTARKIARLPEKIRRTVALAAALSHLFDTATLAAVCELTIDETESHLIAACRERILVKRGGSYQFEHDGLRESAYALIPSESRAETHLHIGRLMLSLAPDEPSSSARIRVAPVFEVAEHLNRAAALLITPEEREDAARLNLAAGRQARSAAAFPSAFQYFSEGLARLEDDAWRTHYELCLTLHEAAAEAAVLIASFDEADRLVEVILSNARTLLDKVSAYESRIFAAHARLDEEEALATCREVLQLLGVEIPALLVPAEVEAAYHQAHRRAEPLLGRDPAELPVMTDPAKLAANRLLIRLASIAGRAHPNLARLAACKLLELVIEHGQSSSAAFGYVALGDIRCNVLGDLTGGYRVATFGMALLERFDDRWMRLVCGTFFNVLVKTWTTPLAQLSDTFAEIHRRAVVDGDFQIAGGSAYQLCLCELLSGRDLDSVATTIRHYSEEIARLGQQMYARTLSRLLRVALELMGRAAESDEDEVTEPRRRADWNVEVRVAGLEMMMRLFLRQHEAALELALGSEDLPEHTLPGIPFDFYRCLILLDSLPEVNDRERAPFLAKIDVYRRRVRERARVDPTSYRHKADLIEARRCHAFGRSDDAIRLFERAVEGACRYGFVHEEALAHELAAELYQKLGVVRVASLYLESAILAYRHWGSQKKVTDLRTRFREPLSETVLPRISLVAPSSAAGDSDALDVLSLERASGALSGELDLRELLQKLMSILLQNTGAQRGYLLRYGEETSLIEASGSVDESEGRRLEKNLPLEECDDIARSLVRYVGRSLERVVLGDASRDERFSSDPYVVRAQPKSILCAPILHQGKPVAVLYLENNRAPDAFVEDRLAAVQLISSQAAVALENARLHHELKQEVAVRQGAEQDLRRALAEMARFKDRLEAENFYLQEEIGGEHHVHEIIGECAVWQQVLHRVEQVAATDATVLILGETGTGKELIARAVHRRSRRHQRPLVKVNCATLPATLIESELFGHERGAFTGAHTQKVGRFELADSGTILLDEIGELAPELQVKLLRVLQEGEFERLGSTHTQKVDVRIIAATNRDLEKLIAEGAFRADLYYRLTVFPLELPPLRERPQDIPPLVWHFIRKKEGRLGKGIREVPREVMEALIAHPWPGNVRELENTIERALILSSGPILELYESFSKGSGFRAEPRSDQLEDVEREHLVRILEACAWKVKGQGNAADRLGLHPSTLRFRMKKLGIERPNY